jgi:hypothetical protein
MPGFGSRMKSHARKPKLPFRQIQNPTTEHSAAPNDEKLLTLLQSGIDSVFRRQSPRRRRKTGHPPLYSDHISARTGMILCVMINRLRT